MVIELVVDESRLAGRVFSPYNSDVDDVRSILGDLCNALSEWSEFKVSGFGEDGWPVDVRTDLLVLLEQLPKVICSVKIGAPAEIEFFEQGLERSILLSPHGDAYLATCVSMTDWAPRPPVEAIGAEELERMLLGLLERFMSAVWKVSPELLVHPWIQKWARGLDPNAGEV